MSEAKAASPKPAETNPRFDLLGVVGCLGTTALHEGMAVYLTTEAEYVGAVEFGLVGLATLYGAHFFNKERRTARSMLQARQ